MGMVLTILNGLPEPGRLALIGLTLIVVAFILRKTLLRVHPGLDSPSKAEAQTK